MPKHRTSDDAGTPSRTLDRLIPQPELLDSYVPLDRSTVYRRVRAGTFPEPVRLGERRLAWKESDVQRWIDERQQKTTP